VELAFFAPELRIFLLPDWETLPYDNFSPHQDLISERLATLYQITHQPLTSRSYPSQRHSTGFPRPASLRATLFSSSRAPNCRRKRCGSNWCWPLYACHPSGLTGRVLHSRWSHRFISNGQPPAYRIELFDDEIDSLRTFDVDSQRSVYKVNDVRLLPAGNSLPTRLHALRFACASAKIRRRSLQEQALQGCNPGFLPGGIEYYLPLFFDQTATLFDYLPPGTHICLHHAVAEAVRQFWVDTQSRYNLLRGDPDRPLLPPADLFLREEDSSLASSLFLASNSRVAMADDPGFPEPAGALRRFRSSPRRQSAVAVIAFCASFEGGIADR